MYQPGDYVETKHICYEDGASVKGRIRSIIEGLTPAVYIIDVFYRGSIVPGNGAIMLTEDELRLI